MVGWLEESWANVIVVCVLALIPVVVVWAAAGALPLRRELPPHAGDWDIRELTDEDTRP